jgi:hypothetical protein
MDGACGDIELGCARAPRRRRIRVEGFPRHAPRYEAQGARLVIVDPSEWVTRLRDVTALHAGLVLEQCGAGR